MICLIQINRMRMIILCYVLPNLHREVEHQMVLLANETWHNSKNLCKSMRDDIFGIFGDIWGLGPQTF